MMAGSMLGEPDTPRPLRIVHVLASLDPAQGGPPQVVLRLAEAQARLGAEVTVAHGRHGGDVEQVLRRAAEALPGGPRARRVEMPSLLGSRGRPHPIAAGTVDAVHLHMLWEPAIAAAAWRSRRLGIPYLVQPHGVLGPWALAQKRLKKSISMRLVHRRILERALFLQVLNEQERRGVELLGLPVPIEVVPNGVVVEELERRVDRAVLERRVPALAGAPFVLFLSRLHPGKGLDVLAPAFARVAAARPDVHLVVAGPDAGAEQSFRAAIAATAAAPRVHVVGPLLGEEKLAALGAAEVFVLPSRQEAFSVALLEAMAAGRAVVATEGCNFPEISEAGAGLVVPSDERRLAEAIGRILADDTLRAAMGARGAAIVRKRYAWEVAARASLDAWRRRLAAAGVAR